MIGRRAITAMEEKDIGSQVVVKSDDVSHTGRRAFTLSYQNLQYN